MRQKGFTLIELLVSMGIIAVLSGMAVFNFNQARVRARDVQRKSDLSQLQKALELYKNDNAGKYPEETNFQETLLGGEYSKIIFNDPKESTGATWPSYTYTRLTNSTYTVTACLENKADTTRLLVGGVSVPCGSSNEGVIYQITNP